MGFAFKANTNDTRESPAIKICKDLLEEGSFLSIYDPKVEINQIEKDLEINPLETNQGKIKRHSLKANSLENAIEDSHAIIILTEWEEFLNLEWDLLVKKMNRPPWIFDTRSIVNIQEAEKSGINVWQVGYGN